MPSFPSPQTPRRSGEIELYVYPGRASPDRFIVRWALLLALGLALHVQNGICTASMQLQDSVQVMKDLSATPPGAALRQLRSAGDAATPVDAFADADITVVETAEQLQAAVIAGARDVQLRSHIDLTSLAPAFEGNGTSLGLPNVLGLMQPSTRSIRGNCTSPPPPLADLGLSGPPLQWKAPQCVIVADSPVFWSSTRLWLDALYMRARPSTWYLFYFLGASRTPGSSAEVYGSRLTFQGDGWWNASAIETTPGARVYIQDSTFDSVGGETPTVIADGSAVVLNRTMFTNTQQRSAARDFADPRLGGPLAGEYQNDGLHVVKGRTASLVTVDTVYSNISAVNLFWGFDGGLAVAEGTTGSDDGVYTPKTGSTKPAANASVLSNLPPARVIPPGPDDPWFATARAQLAVQEVAPEQYKNAPEPPPNPPLAPGPAVPGDAEPQVAAVYTPQQFLRAFRTGVRDIEVRSHLDLRQLSAGTLAWRESDLTIGAVPETIRSIRGKCDEQPPRNLTAAGLGLGIQHPEPWRTPRCTLITPQALFVVNSPGLWLDALHVQIAPQGAGDNDYSYEDAAEAGDGLLTAVRVQNWGSAYITNTVIQGDRASSTVGISAQATGVGVFVKDSVFSWLRGHPARVSSMYSWDATSVYDSCKFKRLSQPSQAVAYERPLTLREGLPGVFSVRGLNGTLVLRNCSFVASRTEWPVSVQLGGSVYSDDPQLLSVEEFKYEVAPPRPLAEYPAAPTGRSPALLAEDDPWFVAARQALESPDRSHYVSEFPLAGNSTSSSSGMAAGAIVGIVVGCAAGAMLVLGLLLLAVRRRRRGLKGSRAVGAHSDHLEIGPSADGDKCKAAAATDMHTPHRAGPERALGDSILGARGHKQEPEATAGVHVDAVHAERFTAASYDVSCATTDPRRSLNATTCSGTATVDVTTMTKQDWTDFDRLAREAGSPLDELEVALDAMYTMQEPFYYRYTLYSSVYRRVGGQGVVQIADIAGTHDRAAIKFYLDREAFKRERKLYTESQLRTMMPATLDIEDNASSACCTPFGYTFPPFVVIECGQSMNEWSQRNENKDFITIFQALLHAVRALAKLHSFGYAHRDIKPGNILRRPKQHDWTLIDFGCAAKIGSIAGLSYSLKYAAPEVVRAVEAESRTIFVATAVDIWAIGVIAFELLTDERAFAAHPVENTEAEQHARDALSGRQPLPWEGRGEEVEARLGKLRGLRRSVLRCLEREPAARPSAEALLSSWEHAFDNMQTHGTDWSMGASASEGGSAAVA